MAKKRKTPPDAPEASLIGLPQGYDVFLSALKQRIRTAQLRATLAVNRELLTLYWYIGKSIVERQKAEGWGNAVIDHLSNDLHRAFPGVAGFSRPNIYRMRAFYLAYTGPGAIVSQAARHSPGRNAARRPKEQLAHGSGTRS
jgi:hypothetical protein